MFQLLGLAALCVIVVGGVVLYVTHRWNSGNNGLKSVQHNHSNSDNHCEGSNASALNALASKSNEIAHQAALKKGETLYQTALLHLKEQQKGKKKNTSKAFDCFLEAAKLGCSDALAPLERLGEEVTGSKQRELCNFYKNNGFFKNSERADYWDGKAKEIEKSNVNGFK